MIDSFIKFKVLKVFIKEFFTLFILSSVLINSTNIISQEDTLQKSSQLEAVLNWTAKDSIILAYSEKIKIEAFCFKEKPIYCTQFHPELRLEDLKNRMQTYPHYINKILGISMEEFIEKRCFEAKESENLLNQFIKTYF